MYVKNEKETERTQEKQNIYRIGLYAMCSLYRSEWPGTKQLHKHHAF